EEFHRTPGRVSTAPIVTTIVTPLVTPIVPTIVVRRRRQSVFEREENRLLLPRGFHRGLHDHSLDHAVRVVHYDLEIQPLLRRLDPRTHPRAGVLLPPSGVPEQRLRRLPTTLQVSRHLDHLEPVRLVADVVVVSPLVRPFRFP